MAGACLLIGDLGGTNARFALAGSEVPGFSEYLELRCNRFASADLAIRHYISTIGAPTPDLICLAAAGPVIDQHVRFTNSSWSISADQLVEDFANPKVRLLNDFEAIAYSIPFLTGADCAPIGAPEPGMLAEEHYTIGIVGPGTGLGTAGLRKHGDLYIPIASEAGHSGFAPETQVQLDILVALRERFDRVTSERLVSGPGLENIHWALSRIQGEETPPLSAPEIFTKAGDNSDSRAVEAVHLFFEILGQVAGDVALTLGASNGIFIAGGIARRYPQLILSSRFRSGFENKGRYRSLMKRIPTQLILHSQPGLLGAAYCALQMSRT
ncbi:MAG: glucokinase [Proteobacteria bacterium]|nr:glucokinase [Pseudomonadota bacterium]